jgi:pimeloyl-ACP methyl ester carboxylesterase
MGDWRAHDISARHRIASRDTPGLDLVLRQRGEVGPPILFVHGATFSGRLFDIPHPGLNWLQVAADAGFSAYALDIRGYGLSKPDAFPETRPYATGAEAIADIGDAVDWIAARHGGAQVALVGWSWGTLTTSRYVIGAGAGKISALALYAPIYAEVNEEWIALLADPADPTRPRDFGPYRHVTLEDTRARWDAQMPKGADWREEAVLQAMVASSIADDGAGSDNFRVPNGTFLDLWECFNGRPIHDPGAITCPTLLIRGAQDPTSTRSDTLALFDRLGAADRAYVEIAGGTHFINAETRAPALFEAVTGFLRRTAQG